MSEKRDKVSIITTYYNCEKFITTALNSISQQIISEDIDVEYIIVDDMSTDNSAQIVNEFVNSPNTFKNGIEVKLFQPNENLGCGGARKYGIDQATGDYFMFLDADDYYVNTDFVNRAYNDIKTYEADIVEYGIYINDATSGKQIKAGAPRQILIDNATVALIALFKDGLLRFNVWNKIYTSYIVHSYPYDTTRTYEDIRTIPFWIQNAAKIIVQPSIEVNWRANANSIIRSNNIETRLGTCTALAELCENFKNYPIIVNSLYSRAMIDFEAVLSGKNSDDPGFNELSALNTKMLKYVYPNDWEKITYNLENDKESGN